MNAYQEENSTFESNGVYYDLNKILQAVADQPIEYIDVTKLKWVLEFDEPQQDRLDKADLATPILVTKYQGRELAVDGLHRIARAVRDKVKQLPYRRVSLDIMKDAIMKKPSLRW